MKNTQNSNNPMFDLKRKRENVELFDLVVFNKVEKKVLSEVSISASSISKAVKRVRMNFEDPSVLVLQKSALPSLGIFSLGSTARHNINASLHS